MSFESDIKAFAAKANLNMDSAVRTVVMALATQINERSPVGDKLLWSSKFVAAAGKLGWIEPGAKGYIGGHFRANNQYKFGSLPTGEIDGIDKDGAKTMAILQSDLFASPVAGMHYIANNVPYAVRLENGYSSQAPAGIYGLAMMSVAGAIDSVIKGAVK